MTPVEFFATVTDPASWSRTTMERLLAVKAETKLTPTVLDADPELSAITVYPGDLHVKADFSFNKHVLVLGNLTVDGIINGDPAHAILMVAGNVTCRSLAMVRVYLFVTGNVEARDAVYATTHGSAVVAGRIATRVYAQSDWDNRTLDGQTGQDNIDAKLRLDLDTRDARAKLRNAIKPEVLPKKKNASALDMMEVIVANADPFIGPN